MFYLKKVVEIGNKKQLRNMLSFHNYKMSNLVWKASLVCLISRGAAQIYRRMTSKSRAHSFITPLA